MFKKHLGIGVILSSLSCELCTSIILDSVFLFSFAIAFVISSASFLLF